MKYKLLITIALLGLLFLSGCNEEQTEEIVKTEIEIEMFTPHCVTMEGEIWCSVEIFNLNDCINSGNRWLGLTEECMKKD